MRDVFGIRLIILSYDFLVEKGEERGAGAKKTPQMQKICAWGGKTIKRELFLILFVCQTRGFQNISINDPAGKGGAENYGGDD